MTDIQFILAAIVAFMVLLLAVAGWAERSERGRRIADGPVVYCLALAVYCTSWTFYGSVGVAARSGPLFLAVYLGPTIAFLFAPTLLRRMIDFSHRKRTGSIADFIAALYGGSQTLGVLVTLLTLFAITPYIALQIKSIIGSYSLLIGEAPGISARHYVDEIMIAFLILLTIVFGLRSLDTTRRQRGIMAILAVESVVKLLALSACGIFVVWGLHNGPQDLLARFVEAQRNGSISVMYTGGATWYLSFSTWLLLAFLAIFLLPRMFHIMVVENADPKHLRTAAWLFPTFLLLINLFVVPIAAAGLVGGLPSKSADTFVLELPLRAGADGLALVVFLGGFAAATSMVVVGALAFTLMISNFLVLPLANAHRRLAPLSRWLRPIRWLTVALIIGLAYLFQKYVGATQFLVAMGLVSFAGFAQLAPALIGGLYWRGAQRRGAIAGIATGLAIWAYTLFIPLLAQSAWLPLELIVLGPFGISWLRPESLFGMSTLPPLTHGVFWSLSGNLIAYLLVSSLSADSGPAPEEFERDDSSLLDPQAALPLQPVLASLHGIYQRFMADAEAAKSLEEILTAQKLAGAERASPLAVARLLPAAEAALAGSIGSAAARRAFAETEILDPHQRRRVQAAYSSLVADLNISPEEIRERIDFFQERRALAEQHATELAAQIDQLQREIAARSAAEGAQRESEARLRLLADNAPVLVWMSDAYAHRNYFNRIWREFTGQGEESPHNDSWLGAIHEEDRDEYINRHYDGLSSAQPFSLEFRLRRADGAYRWMREDCVTRYDEAGNLAGHLGSAFDITEIHDARAAMLSANQLLESKVSERTADLSAAVAQLQQSNASLEEARAQLARKEEELRQILHNLRDVVITVDMFGDIRDVNPAVERIFGYKPADLIGRNLAMLIPPAMREAHQTGFERHVVTGESRIIGTTLELNGLRADGSEVPLDISIISYEIRGARFLTGILRDNTARRNADLALRAERDRAQRYLDVARSVIVAVATDETVSMINREGCTLLGYPEKEIVGRNWFDKFIPRASREDIRAQFRNVISGKVSRINEELEIAVETRKGVRIIAWRNAVLHNDAGEIVGTLSSGQDVTERLAAEAELKINLLRLTEINRKLEDAQNQLLQSEKMASVGQLAAGVAHEINNPVGFINSNLGSLKKQVEDLLAVIDAYQNADALLAAAPELQAAIKAAKDRADLDFLREDIVALIGESLEGVVRVKKIVQDLKDFSRVDTAEWQFASLEDGLDSTLNIVWNELKYKAEVVKEYAGVPEIECIASQLNQVFMNLLVNAAQAIETRGTITIRTRFDDTNVWVEIADSGKGIAPEHLSRIFEPFFTTKPVGKGTGLGLSLAYSIVQRHHGSLNVDSKPGAGTCFRLCIPRQRVATAEPALTSV